VLAGLNLAAGDEIVTTNHEHPAVNTPLAILHNRRGVVIRRVAMPIGNRQRAEDYVGLFEAAITPRTRVLLFSAPIFRTGTMLPIRMLAELAQRHGIVSVVDGAHVPGLFAYSYRTLGVDFLAGSGAKWQCGPARTGLLYLRNKVLPAYNPNPLPEFWPTISSSQAYPDAGLPARTTTSVPSYDIGALLQDQGNPSLAQITGLLTACQLWDRLGRQRIQDYALGLARRLKQRIAERWGIDALYCPVDDTRLHSALTAFNPFATTTDVLDPTKAATFVTRLHDEYHITVRTTIVPVVGAPAAHNPIRVSTHLFHNTHDVDRFVDSAWRLSRAMAG
jgi:selenocysteine lyase/cysteine desulfurase